MDTAGKDPHPRFSAFAVMILFLLALFGGISKLDKLLPTRQSPNNSPDPLEVAQRDEQQVVGTIGAEWSKVAPSRTKPPITPQKPSPKRSNSQQARPSGSPRQPSAEADAPLRVCPLKPRRGDKLSDTYKVAGNSPLRAEKRSHRPVSDNPAPPAYQSAPSSHREKAPRRTAGRWHTVRENETLWSISAKLYGNGTLYSIIAANNKGVRAETLRPGMKLYIPDLTVAQGPDH